MLEAGEVVERHAGELGDLLAAQARNAAMATGWHAGLGWAEPLAPEAKPACELVLRNAHLLIIAHRRRARVALRVLGSAVLLSAPELGRSMDG